MPRPKAKPEYFESILQFSKTMDYLHSEISSQLSFSDNISTSADGSVNGDDEIYLNFFHQIFLIVFMNKIL